jgi:hypothetical protein
VTVIVIVTVDFDLWPFPGRRSKDSYIRYSDSVNLGMPRSRQCPRGYFSAAIGEPARNVFSRKALHLDGLSIAPHLHRPYRVDLWYGGSFSDIDFAFAA